MCLTCKTAVHVGCISDETRCPGCVTLRSEDSRAHVATEPPPDPDDDSVGDVEGGGSAGGGAEGGCGDGDVDADGGGGDEGSDTVSIYAALEERGERENIVFFEFQ